MLGSAGCPSWLARRSLQRLPPNLRPRAPFCVELFSFFFFYLFSYSSSLHRFQTCFSPPPSFPSTRTVETHQSVVCAPRCRLAAPRFGLRVFFLCSSPPFSFCIFPSCVFLHIASSFGSPPSALVSGAPPCVQKGDLLGVFWCPTARIRHLWLLAL